MNPEIVDDETTGPTRRVTVKANDHNDAFIAAEAHTMGTSNDVYLDGWPYYVVTFDAGQFA